MIARTSAFRSHAIFSLSNSGDTPAAEYAYLRAVYPRLTSRKLKEAIFQGMGNDESNGSAWLLERGARQWVSQSICERVRCSGRDSGS